MTVRQLAVAAVTATVVAHPAAAHAQDTPAGVRPSRFTVEGYVAPARLDGGVVAGTRSSVGGYGARVMFNRSTPAAALRTFFDRASVGAFTTFTARQGNLDASTVHYGVQADVSLFPAPRYRGTLDPFVSVGLGALRTSSTVAGRAGRVVNTDLAFTPAVGTRLGLLPGIGFRGDLRLPLVFGNSTTVNPVVEGGIYLSF
jgi:hypothetical protein